MQTYISNSCNICMKIFIINSLHSSIGETLCFSYDNPWPRSAKITQKNKIGFILICFTPTSILTRIRTKWFPSFYSLQNALNDKNIPKVHRVKPFVENFLSSKPDNFYLINKQSYTSEEVIQNNGKYTIDWN